METKWTTHIFDSIEDDQFNWYCASPHTGHVYASGAGGPRHLGTLDGCTLERLEHLLGSENITRHLHVLVEKEWVPKEEMTLERFERIMFLVTLGLQEGPWPPC